MTHTHAKLINCKNNAQLVLSILKEEEENEKKDIYSMCKIPFDQCDICDAEKDHQTKQLKRCKHCEKFAKMWIEFKKKFKPLQTIKKRNCRCMRAITASIHN
jgi:hypothetical protein